MKIVLVKPHRTDEAVTKDAALKLLHAASAVGVALDPQGLTMTWMSDSARAYVAEDGDKAVGIGFLVFGRRWFDADMTATIILADGPARPELLAHMIDAARTFGAEKVFWEARDGDADQGRPSPIRELDL